MTLPTSDLVFTDHARARWRQRFRKLKSVEHMVGQAVRARVLGKSLGTTYYQTPCGAVLAAEGGVVRTVLLGRQLPDSLLEDLRHSHAHRSVKRRDQARGGGVGEAPLPRVDQGSMGVRG